MGDVISLAEPTARSRDGVARHRDAGARAARATFYFDLSSPFTYLAAERVDRLFPRPRRGSPVLEEVLQAAGAVDAPPPRSARTRSGCRSSGPRLGRRGRPPRDARRRRSPPSRARAAPFVLAATRLAFCGGFELDHPEVLAEAAAAANLGLEDCLHAAGDVGRDGAMEEGARRLLAQGADRLPALRVGRLLFAGEDRVAEARRRAGPACPRVHARRLSQRALARIPRAWCERLLRIAYGRLGPRYPRGAGRRCLRARRTSSASAASRCCGSTRTCPTGELRADRCSSSSSLVARRERARAATSRSACMRARRPVAARRPHAARRRRRRGARWPACRSTSSRAGRLDRAVLCNVVPISLFVTLAARPHVRVVPHPRARAPRSCLALRRARCASSRIELLLRPVLDDVVVRRCPTAPSSAARASRCAGSCFFALPAINVVTGVVVAGLSARARRARRSPTSGGTSRVAVARLVHALARPHAAADAVGARPDRRAAPRRPSAVAGGERGARVPVLTTDETGALAASFNAMVAGLEERERLREAFGAFVDPRRRRPRARGRARPTSRARRSRCRCSSSTSAASRALAERLGAREVVAAAQRRSTASSCRVLERHGGHANKFVGDGLLGVFGAPRARWPTTPTARCSPRCDIAADGARGVTAASCAIGVGVNSGPVLAGTIGGGGHVEFTVIGDAVNTAARVEEVTRVTGDDVLITEATRALLTLPFRGFAERPTGRAEGQDASGCELYAPLGCSASPQRVASGACRPRPPPTPRRSTAAGSSPSA